MDKHKDKLSESEWLQKFKIVCDQMEEIYLSDSIPTFTCNCGKKVELPGGYRCLYCSELYCQQCAEEHFGKTLAQYKQENPSPLTFGEYGEK